MVHCSGSQPVLAHGPSFQKYPIDHCAMLTPHEQPVKHKNQIMVLHNLLCSNVTIFRDIKLLVDHQKFLVVHLDHVDKHWFSVMHYLRNW